MYDVLIIGCGVIGSAMAYTLSRYQLKVCVCERFNDVANGVTKANSAILHAGFDCPPGSLEAHMNLEGIAMAREICKKLDVEYRDIPSFVIAFDEREMEYVRELYDRGVANGVPGVRIIDREEALRLEPGLNPKLIGALYAPGSGIINPWEYAVAMAETAVRNGVEVKLSSRVTGIERNQDHFVVTTSSGSYEARYVINAGGAFSAQVYELVGGHGLKQTNFCGQYYVLDKSQGGIINSVVFPCPDEHGFKGILVAPTVHGNLIVGPDAYQVEDGDHYLMSREEIENKIATFTGGRAAEEVVFHSVTTGASNDIEQATKLARAMITRYGMSDNFDMVALETVTNQYLGGDASLACSAETQAEIDRQVVDLVKKQHAKAVRILQENRPKLDELAKFLYEKETITGEEFMEILNQ